MEGSGSVGFRDRVSAEWPLHERGDFVLLSRSSAHERSQEQKRRPALLCEPPLLPASWHSRRSNVAVSHPQAYRDQLSWSLQPSREVLVQVREIFLIRHVRLPPAP